MPTAINPAAASGPSTAVNPYAELNSGEFFKIMLQELTNQDPLEPNDTGAILEQLSSLRNIESQNSLQEQLSAMVLSNSISQAGSLIGKIVEGLDLQNERIAGEVVSVRVVDGKPQLELDTGVSLPMPRVTSVASAQNVTQPII